MIDRARPDVSPAIARFERRALLVGVAGLALCAVGALVSPAQFFRSYLFGYVFWIGIALGCLAIVMLHHLSGGAWGLVIRRPLESATRTLPLLALLFVPIAVGIPSLYAWAGPEAASDAVLQHKRPYLNVGFFLARAVLYFIAWNAVAYILNRWSLEQDAGPGAADPAQQYARERRFRLVSAPGLVVYGLTVTFASIDWVMSLDPHWASTMFGVLFMGGQVLSALAFTIAVLFLLASHEPMASVVSPEHFHDLGKLLLAFVMLWAYFSFSQFLIVWSGNLPEEIPWYLHRLRGGWQWIGIVLIVFHFVLPFLLLLSRDTKRNARTLAAIAGAVVVVRLVDLFWLIAPSFHAERLAVHWLDVAAPAGLGGLWIWFYLRQLRARALLPFNDPYFPEALNGTRH
jgi:hypothetical protein